MALRSLPVNTESPRTPGLKLQASYSSPNEHEQVSSRSINMEDLATIVQKRDATISELKERLEAEQAKREEAEGTVHSGEDEIHKLKQLVIDLQSKLELAQQMDEVKSIENISETVKPDLTMVTALEELNVLKKELKQKDAIIGQLRRTVAVCANKGVAPAQEAGNVCHAVVPQNVSAMPANFQMPAFQPASTNSPCSLRMTARTRPQDQAH